jgi:hypothetical protein
VSRPPDASSPLAFMVSKTRTLLTLVALHNRLTRPCEVRGVVVVFIYGYVNAWLTYNLRIVQQNTNYPIRCNVKRFGDCVPLCRSFGINPNTS